MLLSGRSRSAGLGKVIHAATKQRPNELQWVETRGRVASGQPVQPLLQPPSQEHLHLVISFKTFTTDETDSEHMRSAFSAAITSFHMFWSSEFEPRSLQHTSIFPSLPRSPHRCCPSRRVRSTVDRSRTMAKLTRSCELIDLYPLSLQRKSDCYTAYTYRVPQYSRRYSYIGARKGKRAVAMAGRESSKLHEKHQKILANMLREEDNKVCADCHAKGGNVTAAAALV